MRNRKSKMNRPKIPGVSAHAMDVRQRVISGAKLKDEGCDAGGSEGLEAENSALRRRVAKLEALLVEALEEATTDEKPDPRPSFGQAESKVKGRISAAMEHQPAESGGDLEGGNAIAQSYPSGGGLGSAGGSVTSLLCRPAMSTTLVRDGAKDSEPRSWSAPFGPELKGRVLWLVRATLWCRTRNYCSPSLPPNICPYLWQADRAACGAVTIKLHSCWKRGSHS